MKKKSSISLFGTALLIIVIIMASGAWFYHWSEGWTWIDAFYFTAMTITTVGYGDLVPTHDVSKIVTSVYGLISIPVTVFVFGVIMENYLESRLTGLERRMKELLLREQEIEEEIEVDKDQSKLNVIKKILGVKE